MDDRTLAVVRPPTPDEESAPKIALRPGFRADVSGRSLELFFCLEGDTPWAFYLTGVSPRRKAILCPLHDGELHRTASVTEAFEQGWLDVDTNCDGDAATLIVKSRDLVLAVLREQRRPQPRQRRRAS